MSRDALGFGAVTTHRSVFALVGDMTAATQIAKCAAGLRVGVKNFDKAQNLIAYVRDERPFLVILDFEKCEAEAFRVLNEMHRNADLKGIPALGFVTQAKGMLKPEAEKAGCSRVYTENRVRQGTAGLDREVRAVILHMGHELPVKEERRLDCESPSFTSEETRIIKRQIRKNMAVIDEHIRRIDLFVNHEHHASRSALIGQLRERLWVLMDENDTFRAVLWKQFKQENLGVNLT